MIVNLQGGGGAGTEMHSVLKSCGSNYCTLIRMNKLYITMAMVL